MDKKLSLAIVGLALLCASPSLAGTGGPGWATRLNGARAPAAKTQYLYCVRGLSKDVYFSSVFVSATSKSGLNSLFGTYLAKTLNVPDGGGTGMCFLSTSMADAVKGKKQREAQFVEAKRKIVETNWAGAN